MVMVRYEFRDGRVHLLQDEAVLPTEYVVVCYGDAAEGVCKAFEVFDMTSNTRTCESSVISDVSTCVNDAVGLQGPLTWLVLCITGQCNQEESDTLDIGSMIRSLPDHVTHVTVLVDDVACVTTQQAPYAYMHIHNRTFKSSSAEATPHLLSGRQVLCMSSATRSKTDLCSRVIDYVTSLRSRDQCYAHEVLSTLSTDDPTTLIHLWSYGLVRPDTRLL